MENNTDQNIQSQIPPQGGQMPPFAPMPPQMGMPMRPRRKMTWRERMMHRFGMDTAVQVPTNGALTIPNWLTGKAMAFFFVAMFACWMAFGYEPAFELWIVAAISLVLFFYGGMSMSRGWSRVKDKEFMRNIFVAGFILRLIWVLYCYFVFNPEHFGNLYGDQADTDWYMGFAKDISEWITGNSQYSFSEIRQRNGAAIDDTAYPIWLAIGYIIWGTENDVFMPFMVKCIVGAYCAVCIYRVAKRHYGEGTARMAGIFVAINPNMIYWCGNMFKEAEMVFFCCLFVDEVDKALSTNRLTFKDLRLGMFAGMVLFFMRAALGVAAFLALFAHIVFVSNRVLPMGKKVIAGVLVFATLLVGVGDSLREKTEKMFVTAQTTEAQQKNMEWRAERKHGNKFAEYASAAVFAPLIFTIPFPTFNQAEENQLLQIQLSGGSYIKNIFSFFVIIVLLMMLISGEWRRHVLEPLSGYLLLAQKMWENPTEYCEGWNFGPKMDAVVPVWDVATMLTKEMRRGELLDQTDPNAPHEANLLMLDITKAQTRLGWKPRLSTAEAIELTADWYKRYHGEFAYEICVDEIRKYISFDN